jgi:hypothetical protein
MRKGAKIGIVLMLFAFSWIIYNWLVANPIHSAKMCCFDQKSKLLDQKMVALDHGNQELADQLQLQVDNIQGC